MNDYKFRIDLKVRDYECDIEGIVNNAVYMNYLEHARHEFLLTLGIDFTYLAKNGLALVVTRAELDYKTPLKSGDSFWVGVNIERESKLRIAFVQDIYRTSDDKPVVKARIIGTGMNDKGRPTVPDEVMKKFGV